MNFFDQQIKDISNILKKNHWHIVTAESCTGGLIASYFTELPGSSTWFDRGFVTYSNLAKEEMLSVPKQLIELHGAVSEPVALAMALGALEHSAGQIAVSVTGIAGPEGGSASKPVGTVCFGWAGLDRTPQTKTHYFTGERQAVRLAACNEALSGILSYILQSI